VEDPDLLAALDPVGDGIVLGRQFEEKGIDMPPDRGWEFPAGTTLGCCSYRSRRAGPICSSLPILWRTPRPG